MRLVSIASLAAIGGLLTGCATGAPGSARRICYNTGLQPGTPEFSSCWKGIRDRQFAQDFQAVKGALDVAASAALINAAARGAAAYPTAPVQQSNKMKCESKQGTDSHGNPKYVCRSSP